MEWAFSYIATIAPMFIRSCLNSSSIMRSNDRAYISSTAIAEPYGVFIKDFQHFMMFRKLTAEELLTNICFHNC